MAITPKTSQVITTVLPETLDRLDGLADAEGISRAALVRRFIDEGLADAGHGPEGMARLAT